MQSSIPGVRVVHQRGMDLLHTPTLTKGTCFSPLERERLGLRGLLPPVALGVDHQVARLAESYWHGSDFINPEEIKGSGITHEHTRKWMFLTDLQDRNETLFYRLLVENFREMAPIVYTPTVGWACINFHKLFRRPRGMYFSALDVGSMSTMVHNWPANEVDAIVVTDGSRILGLGDLGVNGLGIPIGKLDLYVAGAGFDPSRVLPCVIDVGTNNERLLSDPLYFGLKSPRLTGDAFYKVVDEFVRAVMSRWPKAVLQFEDFSTQHAHQLLDRYRHHHTVFNDDIQGTAAAALAGIYGALRQKGKQPSDIVDETFVIAGAGSAGLGVTESLFNAVLKHGKARGMTVDDARKRFFILDKDGLVGLDRGEDLDPSAEPYARPLGEGYDRATLLETVKYAKPTVLIGLTAAGGIFTPEILETMNANCVERPIVFPMSNPTIRLECTHEQALESTQGRAIFASGSPQPDIERDGVLRRAAQANNMYVFPGLAFGALLAQGGLVSDEMIMAAAEAVPKALSEGEIAAGVVYPDMGRIRDISTKVASNVIKAAAKEGNLKNELAIKALEEGDEALAAFVRTNMYKPKYSKIVYKPVQ